MAGDRDAQWTEQVRAAQRGDRDAFAALYATFAGTVHAIVMAHVGAQAAEDVTQEVFCAVFASLPTLREPAAFAGFVCTAARNAARDVLRQRRQASPSAHDTVDDVAGRDASPAASAEQRELAERVLATIRTLPEAYRETLVLRLVGGLSGPEIAERTGMTHGSVRVNLTRGMQLLRPLLQEAGLP
jgi:RNA polymerase sigma-70 factor (ECF subfamily)